jgi:hypothetical protein
MKDENILIEEVFEKNKIFKYSLNFAMLGGSLGFLLTGLSSYFNYNFLFFFNAERIIFFPQGITMCFYGFFGTLISLNQVYILALKIGEGFTEFNKNSGLLTIYRKGIFSDINIVYSLQEIEAIKVDFKNDLFNTSQKILVCIKGKNDIPIIQNDIPIKISELEEKASQIAYFLRVPVKST